MNDIRPEKETIILVEAIAGALHEMALSLEASGYHLVCLPSKEVFSSLKGESVLILDSEIPGEEALQICGQASGMADEQQYACLLVVTSMDIDPLRQQLLRDGLAHGVVPWPASGIILQSCIRPHIRLLSATQRFLDSKRTSKGLFENSHAVMLLVDPNNGRIVDANPAAERYYGWSRASLCGMHIGNINTLSPEEIAKAMADARALDLYYFQFKHRKADGSVRDVEVYSGPVHYNNKDILFSIVFDISERKRAEADLIQARQNWEDIFQAIGHSTLILDSKFRILEANRATVELTGLSAAELRGRNCYEVFHSTKAPPRLCPQLQFAQKAMLEISEIQIETLGGMFLVSCTPVFDKAGKLQKVIHIATDISQRKIAEDALRESEERFRLLADDLPALVCEFLPDSTLTYVNKAYCEYFQSTSEKLLGYRFLDFVPAESRVEAMEHYQSLTVAQSVKTIVHEVIRNGQRQWMERIDHAIFDEFGKNVRFQSIGIDITERRQARLELIAANKDLENALAVAQELADLSQAANKAKNEFLANMSHEIRTPLNGICGMLQLLQTTSLDEEQKIYVETAFRSSGRLTDLLNDILDLSRIEVGKLPIHHGAFELRSLQEQLLDVFSLTARNKNITFFFNFDQNLPVQVMGDEIRLRQILFNLVGNAVKFTEIGGVEVSVKSLNQVHQRRIRVLFSVMDTGPGIEDEIIDEVFEPFAQAENVYVRKHQGAGLGLTIVRRLVDLMGGEITLENEFGSGCTFVFSLPFEVPDHAPEKGFASEDIESSDASWTILIAEDDFGNAFFLKRILEKDGHQVTTVRNGSEALESLQAGSFDIVFMDIQMPVMDGLEATRIIRSSESPASKVPIIALTAYAMVGDREKFLGSGMDGYISKPAKPGEIRKVISEVMKTRMNPAFCDLVKESEHA
ncbi:MAG: PAS domain S-box protein [Proteobacteria bacterium]|nr:PAS domain S-box protein [Pseudomonadota bacterium]